MDRLFLDANVLFSAAYGSPKIRAFWDHAQHGRCQLLASAYVLEEARRNLPPGEPQTRLDVLSEAIELVPEAPVNLPSPIFLPAKDRPVLLSAVAGQATHLITGDFTHFGPYYGQRVQTVLILPPAVYLQNLRKS